ncbi:MAG: hypothetical protein A2Y61_03595 [Chloroflexi bacterium RBG_13_60_13]|nr:MAG: hypothetical protein A2Y61_03595 [Chloroflexi bacterium RBG_13_60_13]
MPLSQARLSPFDYGFLYGYGLFETMRAYSGHVFRLEAHLARLRRAAQALDMSLDGIPDLSKALYDTLEANRLSNARIRLTLSGGPGEPVPDITTCREPTVLITARDYVHHSNSVYRQGFKAIVSSTRRNTHSRVSGLKSLNNLDNLLARREAKLAGADEAILLNDQGFIAEGSSTNIFLVSGNILHTPGEDCGILPGVTRAVVLELARSARIKAIEKKVALEEFAAADEAFCTSSLIEIMPITRIGEEAIGPGVPGTVTEKLTAAYRRLVESVIHGAVR